MIKSPTAGSKRSPSPKTKLKQQSLSRTDESFETKSINGLPAAAEDEVEANGDAHEADMAERTNDLTSESIVEEPAEPVNPLVERS